MDPKDRLYLRDLARRVAEIAADPIQAERRKLWYAQNVLKPIKPLVFCSPEGSWVELVPESTLRLQEQPMRGWEYDLRMRIYTWEHFGDDQVIDAVLDVSHVSENSGWGVTAPQTRTSDTARGSYIWDPPVKELSDLDKLRYPEVTVDWEATQKRLELAQELFGDILQVRLRSSWWWSLGLMNPWATLRGLEQLMVDMVDNPEWMHRAMRFLSDGQLHFLDNLQEQGLLSLNNGNQYVGSGTWGWTDELPVAGYRRDHVRTQDMWGFTEGQEITAVSPAMHWEFAMQYEVPIHKRFGLTYYGCCEPLEKKFEYVKRLPNLRAVSVSPWCDIRIAAEALQDAYIYSWKPHPAHLAAVHFDSDYVRAYIREMLEVTRGCVVMMSLKDTHTCNQQPWRFDEWTRVAQEETLRAAERG